MKKYKKTNMTQSKYNRVKNLISCELTTKMICEVAKVSNATVYRIKNSKTFEEYKEKVKNTTGIANMKRQQLKIYPEVKKVEYAFTPYEQAVLAELYKLNDTLINLVQTLQKQEPSGNYCETGNPPATLNI